MRYARTVVLSICLLVIAGCTSIPLATDKQGNTVAHDVATQFKLALNEIRKKRYAHAETVLVRLAQRNPDLSGLYANLGIVYYRTQRYEKAEKAFKKALKLHPDRAETYNHLGILYRNLGRFNEARSAYLKALDLNPGYSYAHLNIGILYDLYMLDHTKALKHYEKYMELTGAKDQQVSNWIKDIKNRLKLESKSNTSMARK